VTERSPDRPAHVAARVLQRTGLGFPRGMLGEDVARLAAALDEPEADGAGRQALVTVATRGLWADLQPSTRAAVQMHLARADGQDLEDLTTVLAWAESEDADNPLARAMTVRAAHELAAALRNAEDHLRAAEPAVAGGGRDGAIAAARALGTAVVVLLDLDPEDFAPEIVDYVDRDQGSEALDELARATGDLETRRWAREVLRALDVAGAPTASEAVRRLACGNPPDDPAADAVWVPAILALAQEGLERAVAHEAETAG
jgi:hypothetical protein